MVLDERALSQLSKRVAAIRSASGLHPVLISQIHGRLVSVRVNIPFIRVQTPLRYNLETSKSQITPSTMRIDRLAVGLALTANIGLSLGLS